MRDPGDWGRCLWRTSTRHSTPFSWIPPPAARRVGMRVGSLRADAPLFVEAEVAGALRCLQKSSAPGPDGLSVPELKKILAEILAHIFNNWLAFGHLPGELRASRTVFIPKSPDASTAGELRPITISSLLVRTFSWLLLMRLQEDHSFHPLQSGFSNDRAAQSNLLILQGLMKDAKKNHRPFFAASLDLRKAFDSVSHCALLASLEEWGRMGTTWPQSETCTPSKQLLFPIEGRRTAGEFTCRGE